MNSYRKAFFLFTVTAKWLMQQSMLKLRSMEEKVKPCHIIFCMVDHFEPGTGSADYHTEKERMQILLSRYPKLAANHRDFFGNHPKRTWFMPPHYHRNNNLKELVSLCERGCGEIELHLHHGKSRPDTAENLEKTILQCIQEYGYFGIFGGSKGCRRYGFIHGDWALNNSRYGNYCGVDNEIEILEKTGCYADFSFPSLRESNPVQINSIYYAQHNPKKRDSYKRGARVRKLGRKKGNLMIIQGPLHPFFIGKRITDFRYCGDAITGVPPVTERQIDLWVKTGIHIKGKRNWMIIKTHTHGAVYNNAVLGEEMDFIFRYLETKYNDGLNYILHYVTARELYNIIKAIEFGIAEENPEDYRNFEVPIPRYDSSPNIAEASDYLKGLVAKTYEG